MKNDNWNSDRPNLVTPRLKDSPAKSYFTPEIRRVSITASTDDADFIPPSGDGRHADLLANMPDGPKSVPRNGSTVVDCGLEVRLPAGYRLRVESASASLAVSLLESPRLKLNIFNMGDEMVLTHKQRVAKIWIEPVYFMEWVLEGEK